VIGKGKAGDGEGETEKGDLKKGRSPACGSDQLPKVNRLALPEKEGRPRGENRRGGSRTPPG